MQQNATHYKIAVLLSGGGTSLQNLIDLRAAGRLSADIALVIASRPDAGGLTRARTAGITACVCERKSFTSDAAFSVAVMAELDAAKVDAVVLAGFLSKLDLPPRYDLRAINIHPSLLPSFGGRGMYGKRVHQAVLDHGCKVSGCTVHFVTADYDAGPVILQRTCPVLDDDTADTLAARVFAEEKIALPEAVNLLATGRLALVGRRVATVSPQFPR